jgi:MFS family permease
MIGCGLSGNFAQLLAARCLTGVGSALQNTGAQLFLADISTAENRAQCLGTNQV